MFDVLSKKLLTQGDNYFSKVCRDLKVEKAHFKLCKYSIKVGKKATHSAVMGELGRYPLFLEVLLSIIKYWIAYLKLILHELYYLSVYSFQKPYINKTKKVGMQALIPKCKIIFKNSIFAQFISILLSRSVIKNFSFPNCIIFRFKFSIKV
jgi:hypothetical protein